MALKYLDKGPWRARKQTKKYGGRVFIESDDFTYDVRLYVDGDFEDTKHQLAYAKALAKFLNSALGVVAPKSVPNS